MDHRITHACGHEQVHHLTGYDNQQERKARWLQTTSCRACFIARKRAEEAEAAVLGSAAIAHLDLPPLIGSDRQTGWASTIRTKRLAALTIVYDRADYNVCLRVINAKWWIDHRDVPDLDLMAAAAGLPERQQDQVDAANKADKARAA